MPPQRQNLSQSRRALPLYVLLLSTLALAGILGYQAFDAARSHRATARQTLRDYALLASWRYQDWALWVIEVALADVFRPLGHSYQVDRDTLVNPAVLIGAPRNPALSSPPMPDLDYAFRIERRTGKIITAGPAPGQAKLEWIKDAILIHAHSSFDVETEPFGMVFEVPFSKDEIFVYAIRANLSGDEYIYGFGLDWKVLPGVLKETPMHLRLLPPSLTGPVSNEAMLSIALRMSPEHMMVVLGDSLPREYWASEPMRGAFAGIVVHVGLDPDAAGNLVIGGLPASRLPIVLGAFLLTAGLILAAAHQIRRENELARLRADFAMGVSHELRTPLTQIRMFLESVLLGRTVSASQRQQYLEIAHEEAMRLSNLIDNVLRFSKMERGAARLDTRILDLSDITKSVVESWISNKRGQPADVRLQLVPALAVNADPEALRVVLTNVVENAVKYGPAGQTIRVGTEKKNGKARLWVSDEGPGIPRSERTRIWRPYHRLDRDAKSAVSGTGIGLSIVWEFVRLHGGKVWVEDADSRGARFVIELPLHHELPPALGTEPLPRQDEKPASEN